MNIRAGNTNYPYLLDPTLTLMAKEWTRKGKASPDVPKNSGEAKGHGGGRCCIAAKRAIHSRSEHSNELSLNG